MLSKKEQEIMKSIAVSLENLVLSTRGINSGIGRVARAIEAEIQAPKVRIKEKLPRIAVKEGRVRVEQGRFFPDPITAKDLVEKAPIVRKREGDPRRHGKRWNRAEAQSFIFQAADGVSITKIAAGHERKRNGIIEEAHRHGYKIRGDYILGVRASDNPRASLKK